MNKGIRRGVPPVDPALDVQAFRDGGVLVMRAHRAAGSRFRYGVLVVNGGGSGSVTWHRGVLARYRAAGEPLRMPVELTEIRSPAEAPALQFNPFTWVVALRAGGQLWTLRVHVWDIDLFLAALGIENAVGGTA